MTEFGSIKVEIIRAKNNFFPGKRKRAKPNATKEHDRTVKATVGRTITKVLTK